MIKILHEGEIFGELSYRVIFLFIKNKVPRNATIICKENTVFAGISSIHQKIVDFFNLKMMKISI